MDKKTNSQLLSDILDVLKEINDKIGMSKKEKNDLIDEKIRDNAKDELIDLGKEFDFEN